MVDVPVDHPPPEDVPLPDVPPPCPPRMSSCGSVCVDTVTDPMHCGACDNACSTGTVCAAGICGPPRIHALHPPIVDGASGTVVIEGAFGATATVTFPGTTTPVTARVLGPGRIEVAVPPDATAGALTVRTAGATTTSPLRFRRASFGLGLQPFRARYEQADYARQTPSLTTARVHAATLNTGAWLYLLGGADASGAALNSIERAMINADGTLGAFQTSSITLGSLREGAAAVRVGDAVYLLGGASRSPLRSIERATLNPDGTLGPFSPLTEQLVQARSGHVVEVIGSYVYVFGGGTDVVERAPIGSDGSLGAFEPTQSGTLERRSHPTAQVIGGYVYLMGGANGGTASRTVERAEIRGGGLLGPFTMVGMLSSAREGASSVALGNRVFVAGGTDGTTARNTVEFAEINPDGTLRAFAPSPNSRLSTARHGASSALVGNYWYTVGGAATDPLRGLDRAEMNVSRAFGAPRNNPPPGLAGLRGTHSAVAIGPYVYVLGGHGDGGLSDTRGTERARVRDDGTFEPFQGYSPVSAATQYRVGTQVAVVGSFLYLIGGVWGSTYSGTMLRIQINDDASLGPVMTMPAGTDLVHGRALVLDDRVCVFGGTNATEYPRNPTCASIGSGGTLSMFSRQSAILPEQRHHFTGLLLDDGAYLVGGSETSAQDDTHIRGVVRCVITGVRQECATVTSGLAVPRSISSGVVVGNALALVGGGNNRMGRHLTSAERLPIAPSGGLASGALVESFSLSLGIFFHASIVIDNNLWLLGGYVPDMPGDQLARSHQLIELR